jgi:hypothetical protein
MNQHQVADRTKEMIGLMCIGDGVLAAAWPREHALLWLQGPEWWSSMVRPFAENPNVTRLLGIAEVGLGLWLARRSMNRGADEPVAALPSL